ncbi:MAG: acyl--CoA ligase [Cyanobacteria bacterium SZAS LIN-3]|nr:acyl--CoA ligase [Cyanobacteria bacterium SZAS LIN-3]
MTVQTPTTATNLRILLEPAQGELDNPAFIQMLGEGKERIVTRPQYNELILKAITMLESAGVKAGDRVVMTAPNMPELAAVIIASWRLGAMAVPVDFRMTVAEMANVAKKLRCKLAIVYKPGIKDIETLESELKGSTVSLRCLTQLESFAADKKERPLTAFQDLSNPAFLILTSGTTGTPKGAEHDLETLVINIHELAEMAQIKDVQKALIPVPVSHVLGLEVMLAVLLVKGTVLFAELSIPGIVKAINLHKPEILVGVPTIYGALTAMPEGSVDMSNARVILVGGAPLPLSLASDFEKRFGKRLNNGYGSTESKIIAVNIDGPVESVGKIAPSTTIEIRDPNGKVLPDGEQGEIVICGPILMKGYVDNPESTKDVLEHHRYKTGDYGYMKDGYLYIAGRAKEMIIVAGNKVFPSEVEDSLRKEPLVKEIAVVGVPHSRLGQMVKAVIVINEGEWSDKLNGDEASRAEAKKALKEEMKNFCNEHLKRELRPMEWEFCPANKPLPKTSSGKVDKKQLSD